MASKQPALVMRMPQEITAALDSYISKEGDHESGLFCLIPGSPHASQHACLFAVI